MAEYRAKRGDVPDWGDDSGGRRPPPLPPRPPTMPLIPTLIGLALIVAIVYGGYVWFIVRQVVGPGEVLIVIKKNGSKSLPGDQIIIPREPDRTSDPAAWQAWHERWGDYNGIKEEVYPEGTYFNFNPFDFERDIRPLSQMNAIVPDRKVGIVFRKFGEKLPPGQVLADPDQDQRGPLPIVLPPGTHRKYANPHAYEIRHVDALTIGAGHRGVITVMGTTGAHKGRQINQYLVDEGHKGVQQRTEPEGFLQLNPFVQRVTPISIRSQRFEMSGEEIIRFPSSDSFEITLEGFVEWSIIPEKLPLLYVQYGEGGDLIEFIEQRVILPYARSYCRLVGSRYKARDFISGETRLKFQDEFAKKLREACDDHGIEILQALVRDIVPPQAIKEPINEREIAREQIQQLEQQIIFARTEAERVTQQEIGKQNQAIGDANKRVVSIVQRAVQDRDVALTKARQDLAVAKLRLEAAQKQADATVARGQAEANVILLQRQAEAEPLRQQVAAFGDGEAFARFHFYQQIAPSVKSILSNTEGPFGEMFRQFTVPTGPPPVRVTGARGE
jgi:regulator of protease activity HflC (stomatin/prohibitin superfamily)